MTAGEGAGAAGDLFGPDDGADDQLGGGSDAPASFPKPAGDAGEGGRIGRPPGALNRKTAQLQKLYAARGFKDPILWQGELLTLPPVELRKWLAEQGGAVPSLLEVIDLQRKVAADLAPYLHGKMPIRIDHGDQRLPVLIIRGDTDQVTLRREREALSIGMATDDAETAENSQSGDGDA